MNKPVENALLPAAYSDRLKKLSLAPAWLNLGQLVPQGLPIRHVQPAHWPFKDARECLMEASGLVPIERAERRVLGLVNPGHGRLATTPSIFAGLQLILPGEHAPPHRHVPAAARLAIEGEGGVTRVNDIDIPMHPGDLVLTPPHHWHSHHHYSGDPMIWLDILDHPISVPMEASYLSGEHDEFDSEKRTERRYRTAYLAPGLVPFRGPDAVVPRFPLWHFPWKTTWAVLTEMSRAASRDEPVQVMFVNPETGQSLFDTMCFSVLMLRPGEELAMKTRSASSIWSVIEGDGESQIDTVNIAWEAKDTIACPTFARVTHRNLSSANPAFLLIADDSPMQSKLGFYSERN